VDDFVVVDVQYADGTGETSDPMTRYEADWLMFALGIGFRPSGSPEGELRAKIVPWRKPNA
jgi:hypothetical protein